MILTNKSNPFQSSRLSLTYLNDLMGPLGLYQHALLDKPRLEEGYCTDDNIRLLQLLVELSRFDDNLELADAQNINKHWQLVWQFLVEAQNPDGTFKNFRDIHGQWLDAKGTEDTHGRVMRALVIVIKFDSNQGRRSDAAKMLQGLLPHTHQFQAIRGAAETLIALAELPIEYQTELSKQTTRLMLEKVLEHWSDFSDKDWPWFEGRVTYASALMPHSLLVAKQTGVLPSDKFKILADSAAFLIRSTIENGLFIPIGNKTWHSKGADRGLYDQQPIEAHTMFDFLLAYDQDPQSKLDHSTILAPYLWFFGQNTKRLPVVNEITGGCADGLCADGLNLNQGAESLLAYLRSAWLLSQAPEAMRQEARRLRTELVRRLADTERPT